MTSGPQPAAADNYKWKAFASTAMVLFVMVMDFSVTFLALPTIADEFEVTLRAVTWVAIASSLTVTAIMLPLGRLADITGRKKFLLAGIVLFAVGASLAAVAPSLAMLILARTIMAVGGAMGQVVVFAIVTAVFPPDERGKGLGMITTAVAVGAAAGPLVAGPMLQWFGWRSIFVFLAIPTALAFVYALRVLDDARIGTTRRKAGEPFDWPGAVLSAAGITAMVVTISNPFGLEWGSAPIIGGATVAAALFSVFVVWELRVSAPMINLRFFSNSQFTWATATRLLGFVGFAATFFLIPVYAQSFLGFSQVAAAGVMFFGALGMGTMGAVSGRLSDRFGFRRFTFGGLGTLIATGLTFAFFGRETPMWFMMAALFINGVGMGLWMAPNMNATLATVDRSAYGSISAFLNLVRNVGMVLGQAVATAVVAGVMAARGVEVQLSQLRAAAAGPAGDAFLDGWRTAFLALTCFTVAALVAAVMTKDRVGREVQQPAGLPAPAATGD